jgi:hypothetical protein
VRAPRDDVNIVVRFLPLYYCGVTPVPYNRPYSVDLHNTV